MTHPAALDHTFPMFTPALGRWIGICAAVCVLAIFFFPLAYGPFQVTHGPTTAFRARQGLLALFYSLITALVFAMSRAAASCMSVAGGAGALAPRWRADLRGPAFGAGGAVLRC